MDRGADGRSDPAALGLAGGDGGAFARQHADVLHQTLDVDKGPGRQQVTAGYIRSKDRTDIEVVKPPPARKIQKPGLALLQLTTSGGRLSVGY